MRRWNLFQKLAFLAGLGVTLHLLVLLAIGPDPLGFDDSGWFSYAPNSELRSTSTYGSGDRFTRLADTLIRIAGVTLWTAGAIWLLGERGSHDDD